MNHAEFLQTLKDMTFEELANAYLEAKVGRYVTLDDCPVYIVQAVQELDDALFAQIETLKAINP
jgi:hypothetical protein